MTENSFAKRTQKTALALSKTPIPPKKRTQLDPLVSIPRSLDASLPSSVPPSLRPLPHLASSLPSYALLGPGLPQTANSLFPNEPKKPRSWPRKRRFAQKNEPNGPTTPGEKSGEDWDLRTRPRVADRAPSLRWILPAHPSSFSLHPCLRLSLPK